ESSALWRLPPALTVIVRPVGETGLVLRYVRGGAGAAAVCACAAAGSSEVTRVTAPSAATQRREFGNVSLLCQVGRAAFVRRRLVRSEEHTQGISATAITCLSTWNERARPTDVLGLTLSNEGAT